MRKYYDYLLPLGKGNTTHNKHFPNIQLGKTITDSYFIFNPILFGFILSGEQNQAVVGTRFIGFTLKNQIQSLTLSW